MRGCSSCTSNMTCQYSILFQMHYMPILFRYILYNYWYVYSFGWTLSAPLWFCCLYLLPSRSVKRPCGWATSARAQHSKVRYFFSVHVLIVCSVSYLLRKTDLYFNCFHVLTISLGLYFTLLLFLTSLGTVPHPPSRKDPKYQLTEFSAVRTKSSRSVASLLTAFF